jgi:hypothetical protein
MTCVNVHALAREAIYRQGLLSRRIEQKVLQLSACMHKNVSLYRVTLSLYRDGIMLRLSENFSQNIAETRLGIEVHVVSAPLEGSKKMK